jgi:hypothetical protein
VVEQFINQSLGKNINEFVLLPLEMTDFKFTKYWREKKNIAAGHTNENTPVQYQFEESNTVF